MQDPPARCPVQTPAFDLAVPQGALLFEVQAAGLTADHVVRYTGCHHTGLCRNGHVALLRHTACCTILFGTVQPHVPLSHPRRVTAQHLDYPQGRPSPCSTLLHSAVAGACNGGSGGAARYYAPARASSPDGT